MILIVTVLAFLGPLQLDESPAERLNCTTLIEQAMQASDQGCQLIGRNEVCYGNQTVAAQLVSGNAQQFFTEVGPCRWNATVT